MLQDVNGNVFIGKVWPGYTAYPDFLNPKTVQYWQNEVIQHKTTLPVADFQIVGLPSPYLPSLSPFLSSSLSLSLSLPPSPSPSPSLQIAAFLQMVPVDGLWIDMNEPSNFCNGECKSSLGTTKVFITNSTKPALSAKVQQSLTDPPYYINNQYKKLALQTKTLDPNAVQYNGVPHYNAHNLYGMSLYMYTCCGSQHASL